MIDGKPNYTRLSTIAMADVVLMDSDEKLQFINALCEMFENIKNPDYHPEEKPGFVGRAIQRQFTEFIEGTKKYMDNVNRNPSGLSSNQKNPQGNPMGTHRVTPKEIEQELEIKQEPDKKRKMFNPPSIDEVRKYCQERKNKIDPEYFVDYYERTSWILSNGQKMKDWKATIRTWEHNQKGGNHNGGSTTNNADYSFLYNR